MENKDFWLVLASFASALFMYLLSQKDSKQQDQINVLNNQIKDLYDKHSSDADRLQKLELDVARNNYTKDEINAMLTDLKKYMGELFEQIKEAVKDRS